MNDYMFGVGLNFVSVYLSAAIGIWLAGWVVRKVWRLIAGLRQQALDGVGYHRIDQGIRQVAWLLVVVTLAWGAYSSLTDGALTYKHNDVDDPAGAVQEVKDYQASMERGAKGEITLDGALQPESSESRAERMEKRLDWKSRIEQE